MTHRGPFQPLLFCDSVTKRHGSACLKIQSTDRHRSTAFMVSVNVFGMPLVSSFPCHFEHCV